MSILLLCFAYCAPTLRQWQTSRTSLGRLGQEAQLPRVLLVLLLRRNVCCSMRGVIAYIRSRDELQITVYTPWFLARDRLHVTTVIVGLLRPIQLDKRIIELAGLLDPHTVHSRVSCPPNPCISDPPVPPQRTKEAT